jgi:hypothetical protein
MEERAMRRTERRWHVVMWLVVMPVAAVLLVAAVVNRPGPPAPAPTAVTHPLTDQESRP